MDLRELLPTYEFIPDDIKDFVLGKIKTGTYIIQFDASGTLYEGTFKIGIEGDNKFGMSADLYRVSQFTPDSQVTEILIHPNSDYQYFWKSLFVEAIGTTGLKVEMLPLKFQSPSNFTEEDIFHMDLVWANGNPTCKVYREGQDLGDCDLTHVSDNYRKVDIELFVQKGCKAPSWDSADFESLEVEANVQSPNITIPNKASWSERELICLLQKIKRENQSRYSDLDDKWVYFFFFINDQTKNEGTGFMFPRKRTHGGPPKEGAAIASNWQFPQIGATLDGDALHTVKEAFIRSCLHELGHNLGIQDHEETGIYLLMTPTNEIRAYHRDKFVENIKFKYTKGDRRMIRHAPDPYARPRMIDLGQIPVGRIPRPVIIDWIFRMMEFFLDKSDIDDPCKDQNQ